MEKIIIEAEEYKVTKKVTIEKVLVKNFFSKEYMDECKIFEGVDVDTLYLARKVITEENNVFLNSKLINKDEKISKNGWILTNDEEIKKAIENQKEIKPIKVGNNGTLYAGLEETILRVEIDGYVSTNTYDKFLNNFNFSISDVELENMPNLRLFSFTYESSRKIIGLHNGRLITEPLFINRSLTNSENYDIQNLLEDCFDNPRLKFLIGYRQEKLADKNNPEDLKRILQRYDNDDNIEVEGISMIYILSDDDIENYRKYNDVELYHKLFPENEHVTAKEMTDDNYIDLERTVVDLILNGLTHSKLYQYIAEKKKNKQENSTPKSRFR